MTKTLNKELLQLRKNAVRFLSVGWNERDIFLGVGRTALQMAGGLSGEEGGVGCDNAGELVERGRETRDTLIVDVAVTAVRALNQDYKEKTSVASNRIAILPDFLEKRDRVA